MRQRKKGSELEEEKILQENRQLRREIEIEASLERVRARTMAMQHSDELREITNVLFLQVQGLGIPAWSAGYCEFAEDKKSCTCSMSSEGMLQPPFQLPFTEHRTLRPWLKSIERGDTFYTQELAGKDIKDHYKYLLALPGVTESIDEIADAGFPLPTYQINHLSFFSHGFLLFITYEKVPDAHIIFQRFAKMFEQTYTHFLDLQKAEHQAREAQIEVALEKVRSRSLAMHQSDELNDVVAVLFEKLKELQIPATAVGIAISIEGSKDLNGFVCGENKDGLVITNYRLPYFNNKIAKDICRAIDKQLEYFVGNYSKAVKNDFYEYLLEHTEEFKHLPEDIKQMIFGSPTYTISMVAVKNAVFNINDFEGKTLAENEVDIIKRFANVFEQAYTRFLDLQRAEAQAREAQIEVALEKVRSRSLAMHQSDELQEVVNTVFEQVKSLQIEMNSTSIYIFRKGSKDWEQWVASYDTTYSTYFNISYYNHPIFNDQEKAKRSGVDHYAVRYSREQKNAWFDYAFKHTEYKRIPANRKKYMRKTECLILSVGMAKNTGLQLAKYDGEMYSEEDNAIVKRFSSVFEQAYIRFLDLQKAESQAREAEIELAIERVRNKAIAMRSSHEVSELMVTIFQELQGLDMILTRCFLWVFNPEDQSATAWMTNSEHPDLADSYHIPYHNHASYKSLVKAWNTRDPNWEYLLKGKTKNSWDEILVYGYLKSLPAKVKKAMKELDQVHLTGSFNKFGGIQTASVESLSNENQEILHRFSQVFEQTYTRFLDLQRAEAQAREAQIEAALERVRASSMAMHKTEELEATSAVLFEQLDELGINPWRCGTVILNEEEDRLALWSATKTSKGKIVGVVGETKIKDHKIIRSVYSAIKRKEPIYIYDLTGKRLIDYLQYINRNFQITDSNTPKVKPPKRLVYYCLLFDRGGLYGAFPDTISDADVNTLQRFSKAFEQTYTRFLDLQKAEAQTREAQIEAALERVRARTMSMQESEELSETATVLFQQLDELGVQHERINIGIVDEPNKKIDVLLTAQGGSQVDLQFSAEIKNVTVAKMYAGWKTGETSSVIDLKGAALTKWLKYLEEIGIPFDPKFLADRRVQTIGYFSQGMLMLTTSEPISEEHLKILERFAEVFNITYARFNDLKTAEAQTHKANIEVALERVRARALAMQAPEELVEVAEVMWREMGLLGVEELETSSIYINGEDDLAECWYALKDIRSPKKKLVSDHFDLAYNKTWVGQQMWKFNLSDKEETSIVMKGAKRKEWINYCSKQSKAVDGYYGKVIPERTYHLCKFSNGSIGAATPGPISEASWELLRRGCTVFSLAYSRFKDLTQARTDLIQLKEEKQRAESALSDLKATQTQLIQSEKMASLGELTAGIAHEIQNPLNFVNNFAEVSGDLIDELKEVLAEGNEDDVKEIAADLLQNLEKIAHHGKRASGIVKGMLEHSRTGDGTKEPTDINALADEYLRLAYHGLRAKDKSFNADFSLEADENLPRINVVPQDIGRVLLNLVNNAFYAVNERSKRESKKYQPLVTLRTSVDPPSKGGKGGVVITVKDNGPGIPQDVRDKIFQPFFTTKPTGEGTGLGLSLSYDIVTKGHGGEMELESKEGTGTTFIVNLPV